MSLNALPLDQQQQEYRFLAPFSSSANHSNFRTAPRFPCKLGLTYCKYQTTQWELLTTTAGTAPEQNRFTQAIVN
ncbi:MULTISPECIES: hypothetical protein [Prochlorococcus]|uniref:hypothetical protein n=1 Tax=Prochlorococcus TaxID=1218 RepID=UPI0007B3F334|nr:MULTISPECIES: hypothetical protein [Prochlorococcus]KZR84985.1 hypothetical protein PMIT1327_00033 [Prochlorococcus marinus str. MIT 1327]